MQSVYVMQEKLYITDIHTDNPLFLGSSPPEGMQWVRGWIRQEIVGLRDLNILHPNDLLLFSLNW